MDVDGLSTLPTREERETYALALGYNRQEFIPDASGLLLLSQLTGDRNTQILTGPRRRGFWSLVSLECFIRVEPDGYDYSYRTQDLREWSYLAQHLDDASIKTLRSFSAAPTKRHHLFSKYVDGDKLVQCLLPLLGAKQDVTQEAIPEGLEIVKDIHQQLKCLDDIFSTQELVAVDFEWVIDESKRYGYDLIGINIAKGNRAWYLPVIARGFNQLQFADLLRQTIFRHIKNHTTVFHNAKADYGQYLSDPIELYGSPVHDTILMAYVAGEQKLGLKDLAEKLLGRKAVKLPPDLQNQPMELAARYGALGDTRNTLDLYYVLKKKLEDTNQWDVYNDIERPLVPLIASMERYGIPLDMQEVQRLRDEYWEKEEEIRDTIINSHGLDFQKDADQRSYLSANGFHSSSLDKRVLSKITAGWITPLLDYREFRTLRRNFLDKHLNDYDTAGKPNDWRAYPRFNQAGRDTDSGSFLNAPATGRLSSSDPNLQNQPRAIRSCFVAPPACSLVSLDYSALELRLAASISKDSVMLNVLKAGGDIHQAMRDIILSKTGIDVGRPVAKTANFNLRYGGQADMLMTIAAKEGAHLTYETAQAIVDVDRETYTGYWNWFNGTIKQATVLGYSETIQGRRRYNDDLRSSDTLRKGHAQRAAANMVIQGTGADVIKSAMRLCQPLLNYFGAHLALQVHDELVFWVPESKAEEFKVAVKGIMESIKIPELSLIVEGGYGKRWSDAH